MGLLLEHGRRRCCDRVSRRFIDGYVERSVMKKTLLTGIAVLFLATGTAQARDKWCDMLKGDHSRNYDQSLSCKQIRALDEALDKDKETYVLRCGDKLINGYTLRELGSNQKLPKRWIQFGPRGGIYFHGVKCHPPGPDK
jgi:hypothetical protein